ncbi:hypothetical protein GCM10018987_12740 [Streptomyces cremeus]
MPPTPSPVHQPIVGCMPLQPDSWVGQDGCGSKGGEGGGSGGSGRGSGFANAAQSQAAQAPAYRGSPCRKRASPHRHLVVAQDIVLAPCHRRVAPGMRKALRVRRGARVRPGPRALWRSSPGSGRRPGCRYRVTCPWRGGMISGARRLDVTRQVTQQVT